MQTVSAMNFYYLDEFAKWEKEHDLTIDYNFVFDPDFLSPYAVPKAIRQEVIDNLEHVDDVNRQTIKDLFYEKPDNNQLYTKFVRYTEALDKLRDESFKKVFPELSKKLGEIDEKGIPIKWS